MLILISLVCISIISVIYYFHTAFSYWKRKGVPCIQPTFPFGSINLSFVKYSMNSLDSMYKKFKSGGAKYGGLYLSTVPIFMAVDPDVIKSIMLKDFEHFHDRGIFCDEDIDPLSAHLFSLGGSKWKAMRSKLSPTFTSGKIKMMFPTIVACSENINKVLDDSCTEKKALDLRELAATFATDVIGSCAFGLECNSILNPDTEFRKYGRISLDNDFIDKFKIMLGFLNPKILVFFKIPLFKRKVTNYFIHVVKDTIKYRETNGVQRKDFMDLLIRIKNNENIDDSVFLTNQPGPKVQGNGDGFTAAQIAAQAFVFYIAGFETSSTTMTYTILELAQNQDVQQKLRDEIHNVLEKYDGQLTYDAIMEMHYLDKVINETLRKNPPVSMLNRICTKDFNIENTDIIIEKGTRVIIPVFSLHRDAEYYPNPEMYDPNRFSEEEVEKRTPYTYLPFGEGPRFCIGMRFGFLQTKIGIVSLLKNHKYAIHEKTTLPINFVSNLALLLSTDKKIYFKVEKVV